MRTFLLLVVIICIFSDAETIYLDNASFEGEPGDATVPVGWLPCESGTTPDILPGFWGVTLDPSEGDTYVGLITRGDGSWESICQRLPGTISPGTCYQFTVDLAHSQIYAGYNNPLQLRIWGGTTKCQKAQLLWESERIDSEEWETYPIQFTAQKSINYLLLEAFHKEGRFSYSGNILLDHLTPLKNCARATASPVPYPSSAAPSVQTTF